MESKTRKPNFHDTTLLSKILGKVLSLTDEYDVNLKSDEVTVSAHRLILAGASPVFQAMLYGGMSETFSRDVNLKGVDSQVLHLIVKFIYSGKIYLHPQNVQSVFEGASYLRLSGLRSECESKMITYVDKRNALDYLKYANIMSCDRLSDHANKFIAEYFDELSKSDEFLSIEGQDLLALIKRDDLKVKEESLYEACLRWMKGDMEVKKIFFEKIFENIRFPLMAPEYLLDIVETDEMVKSSSSCLKILNEAHRFFMLPHRRSEMEKNERTKPRGVAMESGELYAIGTYSFEVFNPITQKWRKIESMPYEKSADFAAVGFEGKLYVIGTKEENGKILVSVEIYNPQSRSWSTGPNMLNTRCYYGMCVFNNCIYVCGGRDTKNHATNLVEFYCPKSNKWRSAKPMNKSRWGLSAATLDGYLFIAGGTDGDHFESSVERYNPKTDTWDMVKAMGHVTSSHAAATLNGKMYVCGGYTNKKQLKSVDVYDPATNKWRQLPPMNNVRTYPILLGYNNKLWVLGGAFDQTSVEIYDPKTNKWSEGPKMLEYKYRGGASVL